MPRYLISFDDGSMDHNEAVDRLRVAAKNAILASPEVKRLIDNGALRMTGPGPRVGADAAAPAAAK